MEKIITISYAQLKVNFENPRKEYKLFSSVYAITENAKTENIEKLKARGVKFVNPIEGHLVCMDKGMGHLAELSDIVKAVGLSVKS